MKKSLLVTKPWFPIMKNETLLKTLIPVSVSCILCIALLFKFFYLVIFFSASAEHFYFIYLFILFVSFLLSLGFDLRIKN